MTVFSLAHLTVLDLAPPDMIRLAAEVGYDRVGLRLIAVNDTSPGYPLHQSPAALRETRHALDDTGIRVNDIEFLRLTPDFAPHSLEPFLAAGAELGARHVICAPYDPDLSRLADSLGALHALARSHGMTCALEFFPWTNVPDLRAARRVVEQTGAEDLGILLDTLHFDRSGSALADLAALPAARLPFVHLCDAPVHPPYSTQDLLHAGRVERLPPGEGQIDLPAILTRLPKAVPIALEVPMTRLTAQGGPRLVATRVLQAARTCLAQAGLA